MHDQRLLLLLVAACVAACALGILIRRPQWLLLLLVAACVAACARVVLESVRGAGERA